MVGAVVLHRESAAPVREVREDSSRPPRYREDDVQLGFRKARAHEGEAEAGLLDRVTADPDEIQGCAGSAYATGVRALASLDESGGRTERAAARGAVVIMRAHDGVSELDQFILPQRRRKIEVSPLDAGDDPAPERPDVVLRQRRPMGHHSPSPDMSDGPVARREREVDHRVRSQALGKRKLPPERGGLMADDRVAMQEQEPACYGKRVRRGGGGPPERSRRRRQITTAKPCRCDAEIERVMHGEARITEGRRQGSNGSHGRSMTDSGADWIGLSTARAARHLTLSPSVRRLS
ncbi:hypothetical protein GCM10011512_05020 [Tersicoccus solisilvae]|uniref:Uncharacterized protein n=1 Tax=Tersicoccus solisilvae TaxID=1882339 RepID=A0ABQ1NR42_9MICC|nr:hypothetical protein GCM10011512_05020 [Tersicoccus solisilvae]